MLLTKLNRRLQNLSVEELRIIDKNLLDFLIQSHLSRWNLNKLVNLVEAEISPNTQKKL